MHLLAFAETIQLFPDGTIFIHIAMILGMIWVLNRSFFRPINSVLDNRERHKGGHASEAAVILRDVEAKNASYNKELLDARSAGYELIAKEQQAAADERSKKLEAAKAEIAAKFEVEKAELDRSKAEARVAIGTEAEKMAERIATSILGG